MLNRFSHSNFHPQRINFYSSLRSIAAHGVLSGLEIRKISVLVGLVSIKVNVIIKQELHISIKKIGNRQKKNIILKSLKNNMKKENQLTSYKLIIARKRAKSQARLDVIGSVEHQSNLSFIKIDFTKMINYIKHNKIRMSLSMFKFFSRKKSAQANLCIMLIILLCFGGTGPDDVIRDIKAIKQAMLYECQVMLWNNPSRKNLTNYNIWLKPKPTRKDLTNYNKTNFLLLAKFFILHSERSHQLKDYFDFKIWFKNKPKAFEEFLKGHHDTFKKWFKSNPDDRLDYFNKLLSKRNNNTEKFIFFSFLSDLFINSEPMFILSYADKKHIDATIHVYLEIFSEIDIGRYKYLNGFWNDIKNIDYDWYIIYLVIKYRFRPNILVIRRFIISHKYERIT
jgi:hypothetical protein